MSSQPSRRPVFSTGAGSRLEAFGPVEWGLLASVALIWGSSFFFIEIALEAIRPGPITWLRILAGFLTLSLFPSARTTVDREDWPRIGALSLTWISIPFLLHPIAQQYIDSALTGMLNALVPIFAAMFAAVFLRQLPGADPAAWNRFGRSRSDSDQPPCRRKLLIKRPRRGTRRARNSLLWLVDQPCRTSPAAVRRSCCDVAGAPTSDAHNHAVRSARIVRVALGSDRGNRCWRDWRFRHRCRVRGDSVVCWAGWTDPRRNTDLLLTRGIDHPWRGIPERSRRTGPAFWHRPGYRRCMAHESPRVDVAG